MVAAWFHSRLCRRVGKHKRTLERTAHLNLRDFDREKLAGHERLVRRLAEEAAAVYLSARLEMEIVELYWNMKEYLEVHPQVIEAAREAIRCAGFEPKIRSVCGGTDGSRLSEMGLPTLNVFTGGHDFHSRHEWICVADMDAAVATIVHLAQVWAEETTKGEKRPDAPHRHPHPV